MVRGDGTINKRMAATCSRAAPHHFKVGSWNLLCCLVSSILLLLATVPARAHHAGTVFDSQKTVMLQGTVRAFQWSNPHCWIRVLVQGDGVPKEWSIQMGSTTALYRSGWRPSTLQPGAKVTIFVHPVRDGSAVALFLSAIAPDRVRLGRPNTGIPP